MNLIKRHRKATQAVLDDLMGDMVNVKKVYLVEGDGESDIESPIVALIYDGSGFKMAVDEFIGGADQENLVAAPIFYENLNPVELDQEVSGVLLRWYHKDPGDSLKRIAVLKKGTGGSGSGTGGSGTGGSGDIGVVIYQWQNYLFDVSQGIGKQIMVIDDLYILAVRPWGAFVRKPGAKLLVEAVNNVVNNAQIMELLVEQGLQQPGLNQDMRQAYMQMEGICPSVKNCAGIKNHDQYSTMKK